jgi:epoxyqueuosine reductase
LGDEVMESLNKFIESEIIRIVHGSEQGKMYRTPIVRFGSADNPLFLKLKEVVEEDHLLPQDLLLGAKSVVSFFLPFKEEIVLNNKRNSYVSREWAVSYIETNKFINEIIQQMRENLLKVGVNVSDNPVKMSYDKTKLISKWSQRHVAYICGMGTFGINNMLITDSGCGGRYGSFVIDKDLEYTPTISDEYCLWKKNRTCNACVKSCPVGALTESSFDRFKCHERCVEVNNYYSDLEECDVCGKCLTGPCAFRKP